MIKLKIFSWIKHVRIRTNLGQNESNQNKFVDNFLVYPGHFKLQPEINDKYILYQYNIN